MQKPGYKTTEFWLSLAATLIGAFVASGVLPTEHIVMKVAGFILMALASMGYALGRSITKISIPMSLAQVNGDASAETVTVPKWAK